METANKTHENEEISLVSACAATVCVYNEDKHCTAGQIKLIVFEGKPECGTFKSEDAQK